MWLERTLNGVQHDDVGHIGWSFKLGLELNLDLDWCAFFIFLWSYSISSLRWILLPSFFSFLFMLFHISMLSCWMVMLNEHKAYIHVLCVPFWILVHILTFTFFGFLILPLGFVWNGEYSILIWIERKAYIHILCVPFWIHVHTHIHFLCVANSPIRFWFGLSSLPFLEHTLRIILH